MEMLLIDQDQSILRKFLSPSIAEKKVYPSVTRIDIDEQPFVARYCSRDIVPARSRDSTHGFLNSSCGKQVECGVCLWRIRLDHAKSPMLVGFGCKIRNKK